MNTPMEEDFGQEIEHEASSSSMLSSSMKTREYYESAVDRLLTLRKTENSYSFQAFLQQESFPSSKGGTALSENWRSKVTQWAFNVVDHFGLSREVVAVSMSLLDRYLATRGNVCSGNLVLLTSLTTLHLAVKMHETKRIKSSVLSGLSRGQFDTAHIEEMEFKILSALRWKLYAPTPLAFLTEFLHFLPDDVSTLERKEVYELSKYMAELAVCESTFVERQASVIALAAIRNVMENLTFIRLSHEDKEEYLMALENLMGQTFESPSMQETRQRLQTMFAKVSADNCFEAPYGAETLQQLHQQTTLHGSHIISPGESPSSTTSNDYATNSSSSSTKKRTHRLEESTKKRTNFWYTPSPPHSRLGVATELAFVTKVHRGYE